MIISQLCVVLLVGILLLHVYWAVGGRGLLPSAIPSDPKGSGKVFEPGRLGALIVALVLTHALFSLGAASELWPSPWSMTSTRYSTYFWTAIFAARMVGDFRWFGIFKRQRGTAFSRADDWVFTPTCALIGVGFALTLL
jgi:hypothetical protein